MNRPFVRGVALPLAIFVVLVLSTMAGYLLRLFVLTNASQTQDILATRAYFAARTAIERIAYEVMLPGSSSMQDCPANKTVTFNGFNIAYTCQAFIANDQAGYELIYIYQIVATASQGTKGQPGYVEREVQMSVTRCFDQNLGSECV